MVSWLVVYEGVCQVTDGDSYRSGDCEYAARYCTQGRSQRRGNVQKGQCTCKSYSFSSFLISSPCFGLYIKSHIILNLPWQILGMVQNMSAFTCPTCSSTHSIFGTEGVSRKCNEMGIRLLADIPLHPRICEDADQGKPTVVAEPESVRAKAFKDLADNLRKTVGF